MMQKVGLALLVVWWTAQAACAGNLSIAGEGVTWIPAEHSCQLVLGLKDTGVASGMLGWQLRCEIRPSSDAVGYVHFDPAVPYSRPANYVFDVYAPLPGDDNSPVILTASDVSFDQPAFLPEGGADLLRLNMVYAPETKGSFDVVVVGGREVDTGWYADDYIFDFRQFDLTPPSGIVATLTFVPEPSTAALLTSAILAISIIPIWRRSRLGCSRVAAGPR